MRRRLVALLFCLALLPMAAALAGPEKEFDAAGVKWTLPSGWSFSPVSPGEKSAGFFAKVECDSASIEMWAYAHTTDGLGLAERVHELEQHGAEGMGTVTHAKVLDTTLSGIKGKVVVQRVKAEGGTKGQFRKYVIVSNGKFYQLLMRCWHGAQKSSTKEINAVRAGFRLLKGAGGADAPETLDELGDEAANDDAAEDGADGTDGADDDGWPPKGPLKEGRKVTIEKRNLSWTLPEKSPFAWVGAISDVNAESGRFLVARAKVERKKKEFEKNTPDHNLCIMDLLIQRAQPGFKGDAWIKNGNAAKQVQRDWKLLSEVNSSATRTKDSVKFGNFHAAYIKLAGTSGGTKRTVMMFATVLRGDLYIVRAICWGHTDAYKQLAPLVGKALRGIQFLRTDEPVRGPLLGMIPDFAWDRGKGLGKEKTVNGPGFKFKKPKAISQVTVRDSMNRDLRFVGEGRSKDGKAYFYYEIRTFRLNRPNTPNPRPEDFVEKRAQDWLAGAGEEADTGGKKTKFRKTSYGKAKGLSYKFTGHLGEEPAVEEGWVVKHKQTLLWIKTQYIGARAEASLKKLGKACKKALKFNK